ncbi:glycosyltransferase [Endothiovibrio diazotrophicus]
MASHGVLIHDYFAIRGGGERLCLLMAQGLGLDLCYGYRTEESYPPEAFHGLAIHDLGVRLHHPGLRSFALAHAYRRRTQFLDNYDTAIYSGVVTPLAVENHPRGRNLHYCHTPPRFIYDQRDYFMAQTPAWQRPVLHALIAYLRPRYEAAIAKMDRIIVNSENIRQRVEHYLGRNSTVVYPPCDTERFSWGGNGDYYLSTARLDGLKRVDRIVRAFRELLDRRLIVTSGGPELQRLKRIAAGAPNIEFTGWVDEPQLRQLVGHAIATIYIPAQEDFGMAPVESMAAGKPVIGVDEGGLRETITDGETGILLPAPPTPEAIAEAVHRLDAERAGTMRAACEERAQKFRTEAFLAGMRSVIED